MFLIFDTETTGFPKDWNAPLTDFDNWPRVVQLAWQIHGPEGELIDVQDHIIYPDGYDIPFNATKIHGISTDRAKTEGKPLVEVLATFQAAMDTCEFVIGHNVRFDLTNGMGVSTRCGDSNVVLLRSIKAAKARIG